MFVCFPDVERNVLAYNDLYIFILILVAVSWYQYLLQSMWKKLKMKFMCIKCMSFHCSLTRGSLQLQRAVLDFVGSSQTWRICISFYIVCYYEQSWNHWHHFAQLSRPRTYDNLVGFDVSQWISALQSCTKSALLQVPSSIKFLAKLSCS